MLKQFDSEAESLKQELFRLVWYMRGGINIDQAFMLSAKDQQLVANVIKDNLDMSKKSGQVII
tara:strand:+ start:196 stop:384 length:189 start_codon:yes stop_codon:yes gene_type:complete